MSQVVYKLDDVELRKNVAEFGPKITKYITLTTDFAKGKGVDQMKLKAPWTDRTTNARTGLNGSVEHLPTRHTITFAHGVDYGIWLEVANSGKYQIIMPTVLAIGQAVMSTLRDLFDNLDNPTPRLHANVQLPYVGHTGTSQGASRKATSQTRRARRTGTGKGQATNTSKRTRRT